MSKVFIYRDFLSNLVIKMPLLDGEPEENLQRTLNTVYE
jgi:hypothetical protein